MCEHFKELNDVFYLNYQNFYNFLNVIYIFYKYTYFRLTQLTLLNYFKVICDVQLFDRTILLFNTFMENIFYIQYRLIPYKYIISIRLLNFFHKKYIFEGSLKQWIDSNIGNDPIWMLNGSWLL